MNKKKGFTLVELMATLSILVLLMVMLSSVFIQSYKIINRTDNKITIQNEVRTAIMNIEEEAINSKEIKVRTEEAIKKYNGKEVKEILYLKKDDEYIAYLEVINENKNNSLIEVKCGLDNSFKEEKILLNNIKIDNSNKFSLKVTEKEKVINVNFEGVLTGKQISGQDYILTLSKESNQDIIVDFKENNYKGNLIQH